MSPRKIAIRELLENGYVLEKKRGSNHDIYRNESINGMIPLKRHDFNDNDLTMNEQI